DIPQFLETIDLLVVPSMLEPFGIVCLEAMAAGVPVVASKVEGIQEIIEDGKTGILVPPGNAQLLARAILGFLEDPHLRAEIRDNGLKVLKERFEIGRIVSEYQTLYLECLKGRGWL
ncbi:MAG: glycosyltransferase, partial [Candidatus Methylomirabilales bacterium]